MISLTNIAIRFGGNTLFSGVTFKINQRNRIGLAGRNGAGKSTLLKIIAGQQEYAEGSMAIDKDVTIGYLPQHLKIEDKYTVMEETMKAFIQLNKLEREIGLINDEIAHRTDYESDDYMNLIAKLTEKSEHYQMFGGDKREGLAEQTLSGLGFRSIDLHRQTAEFSGGWRMRIELAKIILQRPDVLLLDEPTNHLDIESISWLEDLLKNYSGAVVMVSHDRNFLDTVTNRTIEISMGQIYDYPVPYTRYTTLIEEHRQLQRAAYENQQKKIKETEDFIEKFRYKATKAVQVQSRIKMLNKIDRVEIDEVDKTVMNLRFPAAPRSGDVVLTMDEVGKLYGNKLVFSHANFELERGDKVSLVGKNGEGKTTMMRIIMQQIKHDGICKIGHNVKIGYYAQDQPELLDPNKTVFETIDDVAVGDMRTKTRDILGSFLFGGEDIDKPVSVLSGGERSRLALACMLLNPVNLLVMDEPTHHLDIFSKDILKKALHKFDGTLIIISHDRYFLEGLTKKTYEFRDQKVIEHLGGIEEFIRKRNLEKLNELNTTVENQVEKEEPKPSAEANKKRYEERKRFDKEIRKAEKQAKQIEENISKLEQTIEDINTRLASDNAVDYEVGSKELHKNETELDKALEQWEEAHAEVETLQKQREAYE